MVDKKITLTFVCPECGSDIPKNKEVCPGCGMEVEWETSESSEMETVDEILEQIEAPIDDSGTEEKASKASDSEKIELEEGESFGEPSFKDGDDVPDGPDDEESIQDEPSEQGEYPEEYDEEDLEIPDEDEEQDSVQDTTLDEEEPVDVVEKKPKKLYANTFTSVGLLSAVLTIMSIVALVILYNWDQWVKGETEGNIGDLQMMVLYGTIVGVLVFASITAIDAFRNKTVKGSAPH